MFKLILLLNPVYVTLFWCLVLNTNKIRGNAPKVLLGKYMAVAFLLYLSHLFYYLPLPGAYHYADAFYQLCNLLVYPMYYVYIRLLTVDHAFSLRRHGVFFVVPLTLFLLYSTGVLFMSKAQHIEYLYTLLPSGEKLSGIFLYQKTIYLVCRLVFIGQGLLYMGLSFRLVKMNRNTLQNYYANTDDDSLDKIQWLNRSLLITILGGIVLSVLGKESFMNSAGKLVAPSVIFSVLQFFIGWLGNKQRPVLMDICEHRDCAENEKEKNAVSNSELAAIRQRIEQLFDEEKIYLNKDLTIWELTRIIGTNRTYISMIINNDFKQNFSSYVNGYRARHAKMLLERNPQICKEDLAEMSGFGSLQSLKRALQANEVSL